LKQITPLMENGHTLSEIEAMQERLSIWVNLHPAKKTHLADVVEMLFLMHESAREAQAEVIAM
jgi:hypothetical protein